MSIKQTVHSICEQIIVWCLRRCLVGYSAVVAREIGRIDAESAKFKSEVIFVATNHWQHLNELHQRLLKLEGKES